MSSREIDAKGWTVASTEEAIRRDRNGVDSPALVSISELLGGLVVEVAALNDTLADPREEVVRNAKRFWEKIHSEGLCSHDPEPSLECQLLAYTLGLDSGKGDQMKDRT